MADLVKDEDHEFIKEMKYQKDALMGDYDANQDRAEYIADMKAGGFEVVVPLSDELFIDIDSEDQKKNFLLQWERVTKVMNGWDYSAHPSRNGHPREHIIVKLPFNVTSEQRVAWQSVLGSDPTKEMLTMIRIFRGDEAPTLFVEKPGWENNPHTYMDGKDCTCDPEGDQRCWVCLNIVDGGLGVCKVCGGMEGDLTTHCCGRKITEEESDRIYKKGNLDFRSGEWVNLPNYPRTGGTNEQEG